MSEHDLDDLIKLSQLLLTEEGRNDIKGIADALLEILGYIKYGRPTSGVERMNYPVLNFETGEDL